MRIFLMLILGVLGNTTKTQQLSAIDQQSEIRFRIKNLGIGVNGSLKGLQGKFEFDPGNPSSSFFEATVEVNTINTGIKMRDNHLRSSDYFDVKNYPKIKFVSTRVTGSDKKGYYNMSGKLTIRNTTKEISFPFTATEENNGVRFKAEIQLDRRNYGVGESNIALSDKLTVFLSVFAKK
jgi:polyisoprenoid-binding protein YceI